MYNVLMPNFENCRFMDFQLLWIISLHHKSKYIMVDYHIIVSMCVYLVETTENILNMKVINMLYLNFYLSYLSVNLKIVHKIYCS